MLTTISLISLIAMLLACVILSLITMSRTLQRSNNELVRQSRESNSQLMLVFGYHRELNRLDMANTVEQRKEQMGFTKRPTEKVATQPTHKGEPITGSYPMRNGEADTNGMPTTDGDEEQIITIGSEHIN